MEKKMCTPFLLVFILAISSVSFALEGPIFENTVLSDNQEILFTLQGSDIGAPSNLRDLAYDKENEHIYVILKDGELENQESGEEDPSIHPATGLKIHPESGFLIDPISGAFIDPIGGMMYTDPIMMTPVSPFTFYPINPVTGLLQDCHSGDRAIPFPENSFAGFPTNPADLTGIIDPLTGHSVDPKTGALYILDGPLFGYFTVFDPSGILISPIGTIVDSITGLRILPPTQEYLVDANNRLINSLTGQIVDPTTMQPIEPAQWYPINPVTGAPQDPATGEAIAARGNQRVYTMDGELVEKPAYPIVDGMERRGIEFEAGNTWSLEQVYDAAKVVLTNHDENSGLELSLKAKGFVVQGGQVVYYLGCGDDGDDEFILGMTNAATAENAIASDLEFVKAYDLSPDGSELIFVGGHFDDEDLPEYEISYLVRYDLENENVIEEYLITDSPIRYEEDYYSDVTDLYATESYIVLVRKDAGKMKGYIERYDYEGNFIDGVESNYCVRRITEGPNGSTIYMQMKYPAPNVTSNDTLSGGDLEFVQINWDGKLELAGPKHVIQEQTRVGHTLARFTDNQFGLLRMEEPETGIVDYKAPIRSKENLVKLQIPYCDIKAKLESGARNLMVEYQGQTLSFPMELFQCDDMLAAMPCQDHATIEIIMHTHEAGTVTYDVQLFVVEQVDAMTRVVYRKTLQ
ncbi:hypothetical protein SANA_07750 [Gottschalkiaceae bacterium SANA]|nr:hypothetical protein SANA_07750 [Gottschalkiaceae bacterium SANA]